MKIASITGIEKADCTDLFQYEQVIKIFYKRLLLTLSTKNYTVQRKMVCNFINFIGREVSYTLDSLYFAITDGNNDEGNGPVSSV